MLSFCARPPQARAAGTLSEICIKNPGIKTKIANSGAFLGLSKLATKSGIGSFDVVLQRLAACALCNLVANHPGNKRLAKRLSLVGDLAVLLKNSEVHILLPPPPFPPSPPFPPFLPFSPCPPFPPFPPTLPLQCTSAPSVVKV